MPLLASPANLAFWIGLCSAWRVPGIAAEMDRFRTHAAEGAAALASFALDYNTDLIAKVDGLIRSRATSCSRRRLRQYKLQRVRRAEFSN